MALVGGLTSFDVRIHDSIQLPLRFYDPIYLQFVGFDLLNFGVSIVEDCLLHYFMALVIPLSLCMKVMRFQTCMKLELYMTWHCSTYTKFG